MTIFTVHSRAEDPAADPLGVVFVKEGFCWPALFVPVIWLLYRRMWLVLVLYLVVGGVYAWLVGRYVPAALPGAFLLFSLLFALEANQLRTWRLGRGGYRLIGTAEGRGLLEAEARFFTALPIQPPPTAEDRPKPTPPPAPDTPSPVIGLFPNPGATA